MRYFRNAGTDGTAPKKMPGTRPGEVQQGGEGDERYRIVAFERSNRVRFLTNQEKMGQIFAMPLCPQCIACGSVYMREGLGVVFETKFFLGLSRARFRPLHAFSADA
jgi:hypothetical protein